MSWETAEKALEGKGYVKIEHDDNVAILIILTEPKVVQKTGFRGQDVTRYYFGVVENGEPKILDTSKATCQAIAQVTNKKCPAKVRIIRHGVVGDPKTTYEVEKISGDKVDAALAGDSAIQAAITEAMGGNPAPPKQLKDPKTGMVYDVLDDGDAIPF